MDIAEIIRKDQLNASNAFETIDNLKMKWRHKNHSKTPHFISMRRDSLVIACYLTAVVFFCLSFTWTINCVEQSSESRAHKKDINSLKIV